MYLVKKLKRHGFLWFTRRIVREFVNPTTTAGKYLKPISFLIYGFINKPINYVYTHLKSANKTTESCFYFFYDFEVEPITYDFAWALCIANAKRETLGIASLKVIFVPGVVNGLREESADYEAVVSYDARNWRIHSILLPIVKLLPCSYGITFCTTRNEAYEIRKNARYVYPEKYNVTFPVSYLPNQAMQYSKKLMSFKSDPQALQYVSGWLQQYAKSKKIIVITLRQYAFTPVRNSNIQAWAQFAAALNKDEYFIVFVADTEQSLQKNPIALEGFIFFQPACWNLSLRSALYELAYLNLGVNTGPMSLCWFNPLCRYITFKAITKDGVQATLKVMNDKGFIFGESPKFAGPMQKWVWGEDSFDSIMQEFNLMCLAIERDHGCLVNDASKYSK